MTQIERQILPNSLYIVRNNNIDTAMLHRHYLRRILLSFNEYKHGLTAKTGFVRFTLRNTCRSLIELIIGVGNHRTATSNQREL